MKYVLLGLVFIGSVVAGWFLFRNFNKPADPPAVEEKAPEQKPEPAPSPPNVPPPPPDAVNPPKPLPPAPPQPSATYLAGYNDGFYGTWLGPVRWTVNSDYRNGWSAGHDDRKNKKSHRYPDAAPKEAPKKKIEKPDCWPELKPKKSERSE